MLPTSVGIQTSGKETLAAGGLSLHDAEMNIASGMEDGPDQAAVGVKRGTPSIVLSAPETPADAAE